MEGSLFDNPEAMALLEARLHDSSQENINELIKLRAYPDIDLFIQSFVTGVSVRAVRPSLWG